MKLMRMFFAVAAVAVLASVAYVNQATEASGAKMSTAADKFLASLSEEQRGKAIFEFDDKERVNWHFIPLQDKDKKSTRKGMPLEEMSKEQKAAALELLKAGTSEGGYSKATTIMSLEAILRDLEKGGAMVRSPEWYFFSVFGKPSKTGKWGWRVEGHHLSLNFVVDKGAVVASTPAFFGANPALVKDGDRKGLRPLPEVEDLAKELYTALDDEQKKAAALPKPHAEVEGKTVAPKIGDPEGVAAATMTDKQRAILKKLLQAYCDRMPAEIAQVEMKQVEEAGLGKVYFSFHGSTEAGKPYTYRLHGPTFVVEFLNVQADSANNPANHIHSVWRKPKGDLGVSATK